MVDLSSFKTNMDQALSEAVLSIDYVMDHISIEIVPTALVSMITHLKSSNGFFSGGVFL